MSLSLLVYASVFLAILWVWARSHLIPTPISRIPYNGPARFMPWGDLITLGIHNWLTGGVFDWLSLQCLKHKSPLIQLFIPSFSTMHTTLVLADLREIEDIVTRRVGEIDRADMMHMWFGLVAPRATIGLKSKDAAFKEQRRLWNVVLSPHFLEEVAAERFHEVAIKLSQLWARKGVIANQKMAFEAQEDLRMATLDGIWKMNIGSELGLMNARIARLDGPNAVLKESKERIDFAQSEVPEFYKTLSTLLVCLDWVMQGISPRLYTWFFTSTGILARAAKKKDEILNCCITNSKARVNKGIGTHVHGATCSLDQVFRKDLSLSKGKNSDSQAASSSALGDELLELLITGHETTASSIAWALKFLTDNPDVQNQLRASLNAAFPNASPSALPLAKELFTASLPYLDAVIAETLRLSNTGPVSFRQTVVQCNILGHTIPAGTPIVLVSAGPSYNSPMMPTTPENLRSRTSKAAFSRKTISSSLLRQALFQPSDDLGAFRPSRWIVDGTFD
ncbi:cytochrome P450, partial [Pyrenochaeta sp. MPI-SDFR-AT-0127]